MTMDDIVNLNIGGQKFTTTKTCLFKYPDSLLAKMFTNRDVMKPSATDLEGAFFIDGNPKYFEPILTFLRRGELIIDPGVSHDGVLAEARYFGVQVIVDILEEENNKKRELEEKVVATKRYIEERGWITLNVRGRKFGTTREILSNHNNYVSAGTAINHLFYRLAQNKPKEGEVFPKDDEGNYLIDTNPEFIEVFLNYLETGKLSIEPTRRNLDGVEALAKFIGTNEYGTRFKSLFNSLKDNYNEEMFVKRKKRETLMTQLSQSQDSQNNNS